MTRSAWVAALNHTAAATAPGHLYVVATPIGNLGDLSPRAQQVLAEVDTILAEDTRNSRQMLNHFGISRPLLAVHEHNEGAVVDKLLHTLREGARLALISDAGTPLVSDPGFVLVRAARAADIPIIAIPGPCAAIAALSISGLPSDRFAFEGFLPAKASARRQRLQTLAQAGHTTIVYESSHRIADTLDDIAQTLGARAVGIARELTKRYEQCEVMPARDLPAWLAADSNRSRGEFVLLLSGAPESEGDDLGEATRILKLLLRELPASSAAKLAADITGARKKELYALALALQDKGPENTD
ncbi:16S rRNA (cytidine(1402)-2'-O)-methyltransferase [Sinimarinibacterium sp. NLF-5-8]|uniref:16S rRNA (cytidine(1402)-2'-O)-methyltransferase n=1 Tax=Sinimarinibacterium sp. NLF-5-8 TaxID=2698684 RepID=UPI00137BB8CE|nr:16S rRNA (cytidine(1402)-2'-O)-methyltransferase [Sinimarinibacterium sp. NLF-5-8]QHS09984.1 16S rRNA (cytidine(1402)-2'-O)-methyltransferase [Sinimarinibacterium sp. NLF-5-8]